LATESEADLILLDEALGRYHAKHAGLKVTGIIGILIKAKNQSLITELKPLIFELREKGVWLSDNLIERILELTNETE
jgi:predicted nucleic acid-binding protein